MSTVTRPWDAYYQVIFWATDYGLEGPEGRLLAICAGPPPTRGAMGRGGGRGPSLDVVMLPSCAVPLPDVPACRIPVPVGEKVGIGCGVTCTGVPGRGRNVNCYASELDGSMGPDAPPPPSWRVVPPFGAEGGSAVTKSWI